MKTPIIVVAIFTVAMDGLPLSIALAGAGHDRIVMPVRIGFGNYLSENRPLLDDVPDRITQPAHLTNHVDRGGLLVQGQLIGPNSQRRIVSVVFACAGRTLARKTYSCSTTQIKQRGEAIVRDMEKSAIALQELPALIRHMSPRSG